MKPCFPCRTSARLLCAAMLFAVLPCRPAEPDGRTVHFRGEVWKGMTYGKPIGRGLDFILSPETGDGISGWTIEVTPHGKPPDPECTDYAWVVTPPFRFDNQRYLSTSYANTAQEAVKNSPREFNFVLNCDDYKSEYARVEKVLWPYNYTDKEVEEAMAKLGTSPTGTGLLWIRDSKYTPGDKTTNPVKLGEIHWIKFEVEIKLPADAKH